MRNNYLLISALAITTAGLLLTSNSSGPASNGNRATGAPGDATMCTSCHAGGSFGTVDIDLNILDGNGDPITEYTPGETYAVSVDVSNSMGTPSGYGFQTIALEDGGDTPLNAFSNAGTGVQFSESSSRQYAEHSTPSSSGSFSFDWTAPSEGTGDVTFYAGANAINGNGVTSGDNAALANFTFPEVQGDTSDTTGDPNGVIALDENSFRMYPNPVVNTVQFEGIPFGTQVTIFSIKGEMISTRIVNDAAMDLSDLEAGIYIVRSELATKKFVKL